MSNEDDIKPGADESDACRKFLNVHGEYDFPDADLVLSSNDSQHFRVHSCVMRLASCMFKDMLDIPLPADQNQSNGMHNFIPMHERGEVVKLLLDLVYPDRSSSEPEELPFDLFQDLCKTADKYIMPGAQHTLRMALRAGVDCYPIISGYILASRYGWERERQLYSSRTLEIDLRSPESRKELRATNSSAGWDLIELHDRRRDMLLKALDPQKWSLSEGNLTINSDRVRLHSFDYRRYGCCGLVERCTQCPSWTALTHRVSEHMESLSLGTPLRDGAFWDREEFKPIWELKCCGSYKLLSKEGLKREVLRILDNLPKTA